MNIEMGKVNEKINRIEELMTNFISQLADKGLQPPADNLEVWTLDISKFSDYSNQSIRSNHSYSG